MTPAQTKIKAWRENPASFVWDNFQTDPDAWQKDVLQVLPSQKATEMRQAMQACAGPGKSAVLAWAGWYFLACYGEKGEHPKGAAVGINWQNLQDNLWPEFSKWQSRSAFLSRAFTWQKTRIFANDHPETWFMSARSWSKTASIEEQGRTLSGLHSKYVMILGDESGDIPIQVFKAGEQALSNCRYGKILQAGNPTSHEGALYQAATKLRHLWHIVRITGDPDDPKRSPRIDAEWAKEQIKTYGRDNPWVMSFILGEFPPASVNSLLGPDEVAKAMDRHLQPDQYQHSQKRLGIDVARFGDDRTVLFPRQGLAALKPVELRSARTQDIAGRIAMAKTKWDQEMEFVDGTGGYGAGVIDALLQAGHSVMEISASGKAIDARYFNKRAECWFKMAEWVKRGGALPNDPELQKELTAPRYYFQGGKLRLEEKDQIKKRLGFSPDKADALSLTFAIDDLPATSRLEQEISGNRPKFKSDYDPMEDRQSPTKIKVEYDPFESF